MKKVVVCLLMVALMVSLFAACGTTTPPATTQLATEGTEVTTVDKASIKGNVMMYSSMKEDQLAAMKKAFEAEYPGISFDFYTAGTSSVMTKIATEKQAGKVNADILWVGDPTHYIGLKAQGMLLAYDSPEAAKIPAQFKDVDKTYVGARIVTLGFAYNTTLVTKEEAPKTLGDFLEP